MPRKLRTNTKREAIEKFQSESRIIVELASSIEKSQLTTRRLVPRLTGLEDSSRHWSVAMRLEHLIIVNEKIQYAIELLSNGDSHLPPTTIPDVKPAIDVDANNIIERFESMVSNLSIILITRFSWRTFK